ncbi:hypothetical protein NMY22_g16771 [Coprinellus aureogranulatus]|nr:hypothetical protein NMY22_g16771 [Coprinellus aureogranulatus]
MREVRIIGYILTIWAPIRFTALLSALTPTLSLLLSAAPRALFLAGGKYCRMHPPSPTASDDSESYRDCPRGVLHIIQDVRNLRLEDNVDQGDLDRLQWADFRMGLNPSGRDATSSKLAFETESLSPAMAGLTLSESANRESTEITEDVPRQEQPAALLRPGYCLESSHPSVSLNSGILPPHTEGHSVSADASMRLPASTPNTSSTSVLSQSARIKRQRRRKRWGASPGQANTIPSLDYTQALFSRKASHRTPFYKPIRPPSISSFFFPPTSHRPPHSALTHPRTLPGYPAYIVKLAEELGEGDNVYPLWYLLLTYWFPEQEGFEVVNRWIPRVPGEDGLGCELRPFRLIGATLAVIWRGPGARGDDIGSPVVVVQKRRSWCRGNIIIGMKN